MTGINQQLKQQHWQIRTLPLAVYREVAAHLEQVQGVTVTLNWDCDRNFDYLRSQITSLELTLQSPTPETERQVEAILQHYSTQFGTRESHSPTSTS